MQTQTEFYIWMMERNILIRWEEMEMKKVTAICIYKHELEVICSSWTDKLKEAAKAASFFVER